MTEPARVGTFHRLENVPPSSLPSPTTLDGSALVSSRALASPWIPWLAGIAAALMVLGIVWCIDQASTSRHRAWSYAHTLQKLSAAANATELAVHHRIEIATELKALLSLPHPVPLDDLMDRTRRAVHGIDGILATFWIHDGKTTAFYCQTDSAEIPDLSFLAHEKDRKTFHAAIAEGTSWFSGPFTLTNGRQGLIYLDPVVSAPASLDDNSTSLIGVVIDYDTIWAEVQSGPASDLQIGLKGPHALDAQQLAARFTPSDTSLRSGAAFVDVAIPSNGWRLFGAPQQGWPEMAPDAMPLRIGGSLFAGLSGVLVYMVLVAHTRRRSFSEQLVNAHRETQSANRHLEEQIQQTLRSEERMRTIIEANPFGMLCADLDGTIRLANRRMEWMFGYEPTELVGQKVEIFLPAELRTQHIQDRMGYARNPRTYEMGQGRDLYGLHKSGRKIPLEIALTPVVSDQGVQILAVVNDITSRKQVADDLKHTNEKLKRSNQDLEEFAYAASHDLQEPLRKIEAFCSLLDREYSDAVKGEGKVYLSYVINGAARMRRLIQDLLEYSRIKTQQGLLFDVDAHQAMEEALQNLAGAIEDTHAAIHFDRLPSVRADYRLLTQLLQNLIGNGIKYRSQKPPEIHVSCEPTDEEWVFCVKDNGIGVAPQYHERIFGIFKRLHSPDEYSGTGIGLAICKRIVERFRGRIWVESEEGTGATFCFTIPKEC